MVGVGGETFTQADPVPPLGKAPRPQRLAQEGARGKGLQQVILNREGLPEKQRARIGHTRQEEQPQ